MAVVIILKNYYFPIIIKNLAKCNILSTFALKNYGKFTPHNLEKLCPRCLASTISVLGLEGVCSLKVSPWPQIFFESFALNEVSWTPAQVISNTMLPTARHCCNISSKGAVLSRHNDMEMGPANLLHAST